MLAKSDVAGRRLGFSRINLAVNQHYYSNINCDRSQINMKHVRVHGL